MAFRKIRELFDVQPEEYLRSVGPEQLVGNMVLGNLSSLSELCSEGKSGAFFYFTSDGRFMIKTLARDSAKFLRSMLKDYFDHILNHPNTMITRVYGYHAIRLKKFHGTAWNESVNKFYFVVMGNFFHAPVEIHKRYDLKGAWVGRTVPVEKRIDASVALKDLDMDTEGDMISVGPVYKETMLAALRLDCEFFQKAHDFRLFHASRDPLQVANPGKRW